MKKQIIKQHAISLRRKNTHTHIHHKNQPGRLYPSLNKELKVVPSGAGLCGSSSSAWLKACATLRVAKVASPAAPPVPPATVAARACSAASFTSRWLEKNKKSIYNYISKGSSQFCLALDKTRANVENGKTSLFKAPTFIFSFGGESKM